VLYLVTPIAMILLARAVVTAPHVALLLPAIGTVAGLGALASALPS
jgi:hypothetical protein